MPQQLESKSQPKSAGPKRIRPMAGFFHPDMERTAKERRFEQDLMRYVANNATLWRLCRQMNGRCARKQRCRGDARECVGRFIELVPDAARDWIDAALAGQRDALAFDDVVAEHPEEFDAMVEWRETLARACL
jgi:hypothetical protein